MSIDPRDRLSSERTYHDKRYGQETRGDQQKWYAAVESAKAHFAKRVSEAAESRYVLEFGCGKGETLAELAGSARLAVGVDVSDVGIRSARAAAPPRMCFAQMNGEKLAFADGTFDVVFGSGILHHLDLSKAYVEVRRVLRPGGAGIFFEPLGHNPLLRVYRALTPGARTPDEHPLLAADIAHARSIFAEVHVSYYGFLSLLAIPFRRTTMFTRLLRVLEVLDRRLLTLAGVRWIAWIAVIELHR